MDAPADSSWILTVTTILGTLPAIVFDRTRPVFWWTALIVFVGIRADLLPRGHIEMGGLVHALAGGVYGCLLLLLKRGIKQAIHRRSPGERLP
jgi:hypothetical protein